MDRQQPTIQFATGKPGTWELYLQSPMHQEPCIHIIPTALMRAGALVTQKDSGHRRSADRHLISAVKVDSICQQDRTDCNMSCARFLHFNFAGHCMAETWRCALLCQDHLAAWTPSLLLRIRCFWTEVILGICWNSFRKRSYNHSCGATTIREGVPRYTRYSNATCSPLQPRLTS